MSRKIGFQRPHCSRRFWPLQYYHIIGHKNEIQGYVKGVAKPEGRSKLNFRALCCISNPSKIVNNWFCSHLFHCFQKFQEHNGKLQWLNILFGLV